MKLNYIGSKTTSFRTVNSPFIRGSIVRGEITFVSIYRSIMYSSIASRFSLLCATIAGSSTVAYSEWPDLLPMPWSSSNDPNVSGKERRGGTVYAWGPFFGGKHASKVADAVPRAVHVSICDNIGAAVTEDGIVHAFTGNGNVSEVQVNSGYRSISTAIQRNPESIAILDESGAVHLAEKDSDGAFAPAKVLKGAMRRARIVDIDCGPNHCVAVSDRGEVFTWGASNSHGQLGTGHRNEVGDEDEKENEIPRKVDMPKQTTIVQAACGLYHSVFLDSDGIVYGMGDDTWTQLARNAEPWISNRNDPESSVFGKAELISDLPVSQIECGDEHTVFLVKDGTLFSCGTNSYGQLGHHNFSTFAPPSPVADIEIRARAISAGGNSTCVIDAHTGFVKCIGSTGNGQPCKKWKYLREKYRNRYLNRAYAIAQGGASFAAIIETEEESE